MVRYQNVTDPRLVFAEEAKCIDTYNKTINLLHSQHKAILTILVLL